MSAVVVSKGKASKSNGLRQVTAFTLTEAEGLVSPGEELVVDFETVGCACTNCLHFRSNNAINRAQQVRLVQAGSRIVLVHADCPKQPGMTTLMPF